MFHQKILPYSYLPVWISISTPFVTQLLFIIGYLFYTKVFFNRLISIEKKAMITTYGTVKMKSKIFLFF